MTGIETVFSVFNKQQIRFEKEQRSCEHGV